MSKITIYVNGIETVVNEGVTILAAAKRSGVIIPTLCYHPAVSPTGSCGLCVVKVEGQEKLLRACMAKVKAGAKYITHGPELQNIRRIILSEILAEHPQNCLKCRRSGSCELQSLAATYNIRTNHYGDRSKRVKCDNSCAVVLDSKYCIHCGRCVSICSRIQAVNALEMHGSGAESVVRPVGGVKMSESPCVKCGQCAAHCPVNAIKENEDIHPLEDFLLDTKKFVTVQIAPAVRVSLGEEFGFETGEATTGKIYAALRRLGFSAVFDTNFGADLTIMEEAHELLERLRRPDSVMPLITTCCPSWVEYMERFYADMIPHFSSCKSPMIMTGLLTNAYYAGRENIDPSTIVNVAVMPCTSKKEEIDRHELLRDKKRDVDLVITTRELAHMLKQAGIDFANLPEEKADSLLGEYSGAGVIFGATGGVMEAALRTAAHYAGAELENLEIAEVRGMEGVKEATVMVGSTPLRVAVTHGLANVAAVLNKIRKCKEAGEKAPWDFIEVMACKGGCVSGGGQLYSFVEHAREKRIEGLYNDDRKQTKRKSYENEAIKEIYANFIGEPGGEKAHRLLHTHYTPRPAGPKLKP